MADMLDYETVDELAVMREPWSVVMMGVAKAFLLAEPMATLLVEQKVVWTDTTMVAPSVCQLEISLADR